MTNAVGSKRGTEAVLQKAMEAALATKLPQITGDGELSWGPRVYKALPEIRSRQRAAEARRCGRGRDSADTHYRLVA